MLEIVEVGPRDGLQNDPATLTTEQKVAFITRVVEAGITRVEVASFVSPTRVPQMADAEAVIAALPQRPGVSYIGLVLNAKGFERAQHTAIHEINLVSTTSDTFGGRNQGMTSAETATAIEEIAPLVRSAGLKTSVTISTAFGCPFEGEVPISRLTELVKRLADTGVDEIAIADTIGVAVPADVRQRIAAVRAAMGQNAATLRVHFHNTRNTGYSNSIAAAEEGVTVIDSSLGGIGGCPFAPKATGNIATEDLVYSLQRSGFDTPVDLAQLMAASDWLGEQLGRPTPSMLPKAGLFPKPVNAG